MREIEILTSFNSTENKKILDFVRQNADILELQRLANWDVDKEILTEVDQRLENFLQNTLAKYKYLYAVDAEFRTSLMKKYNFSTEAEVRHYFDRLYEKSCDDLLKTKGSSAGDLSTAANKQRKNNKAGLTEEELETTTSETTSPDEQASLAESSLKFAPNPKTGPYISEREEFRTSYYTRNSAANIGPLVECSQFALAKIFPALAAQLEQSMFLDPIVLDNYYFENPVFRKQNRAVLSVNSLENTAALVLTEEEYQDFLNLGIRHQVNYTYPTEAGWLS